ncbi:hypothetical protein Ddc_16797 [Ditylenchus destructor]|nr:hypothetical protein Ddc_16797 [Ditylenchus destructor]
MVPSAPLFGSLFQRLTVALSVPTRGLRPLERWLSQCQLAAFGRSNGGFCQCQASVLPTFLRYRNLADRCAERRSAPLGPTNDQHTAHLSAEQHWTIYFIR